MSYRSPDESPAARFADARSRHDATFQRVEAKRSAAASAAADLMSEGRVVDMQPFGDLPRLGVAAVDPSAMPPAALTAMTAEVERAIGLLVEREQHIDATTAELRAKLSDKREALAPAPRKVPASYVVAELLSIRLIVCVVVGGLLGLVVGDLLAAPLVALALVLVGAALSCASAAARVGMLGRGDLPVTTTITKGEGFGSYQNARMNDLHGWDVVATQYSGNAQKDRVRWVGADGSTGGAVVRGMGYSNGAILCRNGKARLASDFACGPRPAATGAWAGTLTTARKIVVGVSAAVAIGALTIPIVGAAASTRHARHAHERHRR